MFAIQVLTEIVIVLLIAYGIWHEDELIELEMVLKQYAKRKLKGVKNNVHCHQEFKSR